MGLAMINLWKYEFCNNIKPKPLKKLDRFYLRDNEAITGKCQPSIQFVHTIKQARKPKELDQVIPIISEGFPLLSSKCFLSQALVSR